MRWRLQNLHFEYRHPPNHGHVRTFSWYQHIIHNLLFICPDDAVSRIVWCTLVAEQYLTQFFCHLLFLRSRLLHRQQVAFDQLPNGYYFKVLKNICERLFSLVATFSCLFLYKMKYYFVRTKSIFCIGRKEENMSNMMYQRFCKYGRQKSRNTPFAPNGTGRGCGSGRARKLTR